MTRRRHKIGFICAAFAIAGAFGCQSILGIDTTTLDENGGDASLGDGGPLGDGSPNDAISDSPAAPSVAIAFQPASAYVHQGSSVDVTVGITRQNFSGAVTLTLESVGDAGAASGVTAAPVVIAAGSNSGTLHLTASATATLGFANAVFISSVPATSPPTLPILVGGQSGTVDTTFGSNGENYIAGTGNCVAEQDDGSFLVGGNNWQLVRFTPSGALDTTFNTAVATTISQLSLSGSGAIHGIASIGSKIVVAGETSSNGEKFTVAVLQTNGSADLTFGGSPSKAVYIPGDPVGPAVGAAQDVAMLSQDEFVVSGVQASNGFLVHFPGEQSHSTAGDTFSKVALSPDGGSAVVTGTFGTSQSQMLEGRFGSADVTPESTFLDGGIAGIGDGTQDLSGLAIAAVADGTFYISGVTSNPGFSPVLGRVSAAGAPSFVIYAGHNGSFDQGFVSVAAQPDGKALVTGSGGGQNEYTYVQRYFTDGGADDSFGFNVQGGAGESFLNDVIVAHDGRIIAIGTDDVFGLVIYRLWQ